MKKLFTILLLLVSVLAFSQNNGINFQGVGRNSSGAVLASTKISLRFSVIQSSETGIVEYIESKEVTTNAQGIFSVVIGDGTQTSKTGNFSDINWKINPKFLKVEMDPAGGSSFVAIGTTRLQAVPFAYYANGVNADNVDGVLSASKGGTGVASISALKTALAIDQINNTSDLAKPISTATQAALDLKANTNDVTNSLTTKVDKVIGKGLSTNDFTNAEKNKLTAITGTNTGDQDLSGYATTIALDSKANSSDVTNSLATKVDKIIGKGLSTNDFTTAEKNKLTAITGTNTGDQDLSTYATITALDLKVDKVTGKGLSSNDFTTAEKNKLTAITGTNTGDQDLSPYATINSLNLKVDKVTGKGLSTNDFTTAEKNKLTAITGTNTGDQDLSGYATLTELQGKANTSDVLTSLSTKVDKVTGKGLSSNDFTSSEKSKLAAILGTNTGDQDLSAYATLTDLQTKASVSDVLTSLSTKVDKVTGKGLSTNDFTTAEKDKLSLITGTNTGDQDLSAYATLTELQEKASTSDVLTSLSTKVDKITGKGLSTNDFTTAEKDKLTLITGTNTGDQDLSFLATKEELEDSEGYIDANFAKLNEENTFSENQSIEGEITSDKFNLWGFNNSFVGAFPNENFESEVLLLNNDLNILIGKTGEGFSFEGWNFDVENSSFVLPNESSIKTVSRGYDEERGVIIENSPNSNFIVKTNQSDENYYNESQWRFTPNGELIFPDETKMYNQYGNFRIKNEIGVSIYSTQVNQWNNTEYESGFWSDPNSGTGIYYGNNDNEIYSGISLDRDYQNDQFFVEIYTDEDNYWTFNADGRLTFPDGTTFGNNNEGEVGFSSNEDDDFFINTSETIDYYTTNHYWYFKSNGDLILPNETKLGESEAGIGFTTNEENDFFISTSNFNNITEETDNHYWIFQKNGKLTLPEDGDIVDWDGNSVINRFISEEFFVTLTSNQDQNGWNIDNSGFNYFDSNINYKINLSDYDDYSINDGDCTSFDLKIGLSQKPKDPENINVIINGYRIPKQNIYYQHLNYEYIEESGSNYLIIYTSQTEIYGDPAFVVNIDYTH